MQRRILNDTKNNLCSEPVEIPLTFNEEERIVKLNTHMAREIEEGSKPPIRRGL